MNAPSSITVELSGSCQVKASGPGRPSSRVDPGTVGPPAKAARRPGLDKTSTQSTHCSIAPTSGGSRVTSGSATSPSSPLRHRLVHRAVRPIEERDHRRFRAPAAPRSRWTPSSSLAAGREGVLALPPSGRARRRASSNGLSSAATGSERKTVPRHFVVRRPPARQGERQPDQVPRQLRAKQSRAQLIARLGGPAHHRQELAQPLPSGRKHVAFDIRWIPGGAASAPRPRRGSDQPTPSRPSPRARSARSRSASQGTDSPPVGSTPRRLAAKSTTVATFDPMRDRRRPSDKEPDRELTDVPAAPVAASGRFGAPGPGRPHRPAA